MKGSENLNSKRDDYQARSIMKEELRRNGYDVYLRNETLMQCSG